MHYFQQIMKYFQQVTEVMQIRVNVVLFFLYKVLEHTEEPIVAEKRSVVLGREAYRKDRETCKGTLGTFSLVMTVFILLSTDILPSNTHVSQFIQS